jgi:hypothetical protein
MAGLTLQISLLINFQEEWYLSYLQTFWKKDLKDAIFGDILVGQSHSIGPTNRATFRLKMPFLVAISRLNTTRNALKNRLTLSYTKVIIFHHATNLTIYLHE